APPPTAVPVDLTKITFSDLSKTRWPMLLMKAIPVYPVEARTARMQGTVNVRATIGPDGHIESMQPIDGNPMLRNAALDALRHWRYRPFEVMAIPRPVEVEIHVIFSLG
ncbi:MAG: energy transducer TonB, partial [Terracidiphilus sp.]